MGCVNERESANCGWTRQKPEDSLKIAIAERKSIFSRRPADEEVTIQKRIRQAAHMHDVNWHAELPQLIDQLGINSKFDEIHVQIEAHRAGEGMKLFLNKEKTDHSLGVYAKLIKDIDLGSVHKYYSTWKMEVSPEEILHYNLLQDKESRKKIDSNCEQFDILAVIEQDDIYYALCYLKTAKFMIIKGKETFYIKAFKKVKEDDNSIVWTEVNTSVTHESVPELEEHRRVNIILSGFIYTFDKETQATMIEGYTHVVPQVSAGMLILKPVVSKYYKSYLKKTVQGIKDEREQNKYHYQNMMQDLLQGGKLLFKDYN